jgi:hypothetical protein
MGFAASWLAVDGKIRFNFFEIKRRIQCQCKIIKSFAILAATSALIYMALEEEKRRQVIFDVELNKALNMELPTVDENIETVKNWQRAYKIYQDSNPTLQKRLTFKEFVKFL